MPKPLRLPSRVSYAVLRGLSALTRASVRVIPGIHLLPAAIAAEEQKVADSVPQLQNSGEKTTYSNRLALKVRKTVWQVFEEERPFLTAYRGPFDGFHATEVAVSKTCLVRFDNNQYSVAARAVGRPVDVRAYADRIVIRQDGEIVAEHPRSFGRGRIVYDPRHYVPILTKKPGALRNGAPFKGWQLPNALGRLRTRRSARAGGDRQFAKVLAAVQEDGLEAVEAACAEALACGTCSADVVLDILARQHQPAPPATIPTPEGLQLRHQPVADCQRYDSLREAGHGAS